MDQSNTSNPAPVKQIKREPFRLYHGDELNHVDDKSHEPIIEGLLYKNDFVIIFAKAKMFKSLFAMQMMCCISQGKPFLDILEVPKPQVVWYIATEGKDLDVKNRYVRMKKKVGGNDSNVCLICSPDLRFNTETGVRRLNSIIDLASKRSVPPPNVIIIDALYKAVKGSMCDDDTITEFLHTAGRLADMYDAALVLVHHKTKTSYNAMGDEVNRGDEDIYGSSFLLNSVDHLINITGNPESKIRTISVNTQRSGKIIDKMTVELIEPDPLYLQLIYSDGDSCCEVLTLLKNSNTPLTQQEIMEKLKIKKSAFYIQIDKLKKSKSVIRSESKPYTYELNTKL